MCPKFEELLRRKVKVKVVGRPFETPINGEVIVHVPERNRLCRMEAAPLHGEVVLLPPALAVHPALPLAALFQFSV